MLHNDSFGRGRFRFLLLAARLRLLLGLDMMLVRHPLPASINAVPFEPKVLVGRFQTIAYIPIVVAVELLENEPQIRIIHRDIQKFGNVVSSIYCMI